MNPARGEDDGVDRVLAQLRAKGERWDEYRNGIVSRTAPRGGGKRGTVIWYGEHVVTWQMIRGRL